LPRPGANLAVTVTSSNPSLLAVNSPTVNFNVTNPTSNSVYLASLQPLAAGTAVVTLGQYPTAGTPATGGSLVYNLADPSLILPAFAIGQDLQGSVQITLASSVPALTSPLAISINAQQPVSLASSATAAATYYLSLTIPAGQRSTQPFYVQGGTPGVGQISYGGGTYNYQTSGVVTPTAFVFQEASEAQPISLTAGSTQTFTVVPELAAAAAGALSPLSIRTGANSVSIAVTSSNPAVLSVNTTRVFLNPGDQKVSVSVNAVSAGQATLTLSGLTYDYNLPQSSISVTVH
jgi:hypothetical protein